MWLTGPVFEDIVLMDMPDGEKREIILNDGVVEVHSTLDDWEPLPNPPTGDVAMIAAGAGSVAYVEAGSPTRVTVEALDGVW